MLTNNQISYLPYDDYAQSANTLFHFMKKQEYLNSILRRRAIIPRYCVETIDYLSIKNGTRLFNEVAILQKCFCDIPFLKMLLIRVTKRKALLLLFFYQKTEVKGP